MSIPRIRSNTKHYYEITRQDLPLSCPLKTTPLWNAHPRVYLAIAKKSRVTCPYCDTDYFLKDDNH